MSKLLILSAGVSEDSNNTKLAKKLNKFLDEKSVPNEIHENLYENIPFLLDNQKDVPKKILEIRKSLENSDKIIIFSPVYNGGFLAHLKNTLDWLSLAYDDNRYNSLFKDKTVGVITSVRGAGGNAQNAFNILSAQLMNYGFRVFEEFHLITNKEHQEDTSIEENQKVFENITQYVNRFLDLSLIHISEPTRPY